MVNVNGMWRCVCELDTVHIHVKKVSNHVLELAICNWHLLPRAVQAELSIPDLEPLQLSGAEAKE